MKPLIVLAAFASVTSWPLAAQEPVNPPPGRPIPQVSSTGKPNQYAITVKGCIKKRLLEVPDSEAEKLPLEMLSARAFTLNGGRDALRRVREHNGHYDEIAGVVSVPPPRRPVVPSTDAKKLGPFGVGVGGRESIAVDAAPRVLTLKVESITHLKDVCVDRR
jgi:hypothetical protein